VDVVEPTLTIRKPALKEEAFDLLKECGWGKFAESYGLEYIESFTTGGYYYALIEIQTTDLEKQRDIAAQLSGSYTNFGINADATIKAEQQIKSALSGQTVNIKVIQSGGSGDSLEVTLEEMINQAKNFPKLVQRSPIPVTAITNTYLGGVSLPRSIQGSNLLFKQQESFLEKAGRRYLELHDYESNLEFVLENWGKFRENSSVEKQEDTVRKQGFIKSLKSTRGIMNNLIEKANSCSDDPTQCELGALPDEFEALPLPESFLKAKDLQGWNLNAPITLKTFNFPADLPSQNWKYSVTKGFEASVKLTTLFLESKLPGHARVIGLGLLSRTNKKTAAIISRIDERGYQIHFSYSSNNAYASDVPGSISIGRESVDFLYLKIKKKDDAVETLFSDDGIY